MSPPAGSRDVPGLEAVTLSDLDAIRLILQGGAVIDWYRLNLENREQVRGFLRANGFDADAPADVARLRVLMDGAATYLSRNFDYHFPPQVVSPAEVEDLFLLASSDHEFQNLACVLLKVMHVLNHVEAQELRYRLPVSEDELFKRAEDSVDQAVIDMQSGGLRITSYSSSRKSRDSLVTKLLAKKTTIAAQVFDRLRFRIVTASVQDIVPVLGYLQAHLLPYNYVIPGQSRNEILQPESVLDQVPRLRPLAGRLRTRIHLEEAVANEDWNRFSADGFRMINFVVDMPLRVDDLVRKLDDPALESLGSLIFLLVEFQVFDEATWAGNEEGDGSHERYKDRQRWEVIRRLLYGGRFGGAGGLGFEGKTRC